MLKLPPPESWRFFSKNFFQFTWMVNFNFLNSRDRQFSFVILIEFNMPRWFLLLNGSFEKTYYSVTNEGSVNDPNAKHCHTEALKNTYSQDMSLDHSFKMHLSFHNSCCNTVDSFILKLQHLLLHHVFSFLFQRSYYSGSSFPQRICFLMSRFHGNSQLRYLVTLKEL